MEDAQDARVEPPRPLMRELPAPDPFPVDSLGDVLAPAARAIHDRVQAPLAVCGQSVLAAATLAIQGHADVVLPTKHARPLSSFFITVAGTGERKNAVDTEALRPVRRREAALREAYEGEAIAHRNALDAWDAARKSAIKSGKGDLNAIGAALGALGPAPQAPLHPVLTCPEPTYEGMCKLMLDGQPSIGIFTSEGGQFVGGHGMSDDAKLRTAAGLSALWDGETIKRVRAQEGVTVLAGRRAAMHLMAQPDVAAMWMADRLLVDQGFMSRVLITAPEPASGSRMWRDPKPESEVAIQHYTARLLEILERPPPLAPDARNELAPRRLSLSPTARRQWIGFADHVETRLGYGGELDPICGLANKLAEHAARVAGVLTLVRDIEAGEIANQQMEAGIAIVQHYAAEALRLHGGSRISGELVEAQRFLAWLHTGWHESAVSLPDIYQRGPNTIREATRARKAVAILVEHGWLLPSNPCVVAGTFRRDVWRIVRGYGDDCFGIHQV
jgi:hypothetical protein